MGGTSRVSREAQARFCERLGVKFPGATRRSDFSGLAPGLRQAVKGEKSRTRLRSSGPSFPALRLERQPHCLFEFPF